MKRKFIFTCFVALLFAWTGIKAQAPVTISYGIGDEITSLDELTSGTPFIMAYDIDRNLVYSFGGNGEYCQRVDFTTIDQSTAYCVYKLEHESDMGDGYYRIRVQNFLGVDYPNGLNGGFYMGRKSAATYQVVAGRCQASGADWIYGEGGGSNDTGQYYSIWQVKNNGSGTGFSFYHGKASKPRYLSYENSQVVTLSGERNFRLYKVKKVATSTPTEVEITGSEITNSLTFQNSTKVCDKLFDIDFDWVALLNEGWESLVVKFDYPTTGGDWMLLRGSGDYTDFKTIGPGTTELEYALTKRTWTHLVLETGNNASGYEWPRYSAFKGLYLRKTVDGNVVEQQVDVSGATVTDVQLGVAETLGTKVFEKTNLDVSDYDAITFNFTYETDGEWIVEYNGSSVTIPSGTKHYTIDVSNITSLSSIVLKVGAGTFPRPNTLESVILTKNVDYYVSEPITNAPDGSYIQPGTIVNVSFETASVSSSATLTKDFSGVTFAGNAVTETENGFSFTVPATVQPGTDLTLTIPAGAIGFAEGNSYNTAQTFTYHTPAVFDGLYYMRNTDASYANHYMSRGENWATRAIVQEYGLATFIKTDSENKTTIQYFDSELWLGAENATSTVCYTDCSVADGRILYFNVTKVDGGYKFLNIRDNKYLGVQSNGSGKVRNDCSEGNSTAVWALETTAEYTPTYARNAQKQIEAVATAAGLSGITTSAQLEAALESHRAIEITPVARTSSNNKHASNTSAWTPYTYFEQTVEGLENGVYKLTCKAMQRANAYDIVDRGEGARGLLYVYANDVKTQLVSSMEQGATTAYSSDYYSSRTGLHYPNNSSSTYAAFDAGLYDNEVWVYVTDGTLKFGIKNPSRIPNDPPTYTVYGDFALTYYYSLATLADALAGKVAEAANVTPLPTQAATDLQAVVTANNQTYSTEEAYETAINNISTAITTAKAVSADYSAYMALKTAAEGIRDQQVYTDPDGAVAAFNSVASTVDDAIQEAALSDAQSAIATQQTDLRTALKTFISSVIINDGAYFDLTSLMVNPKVLPKSSTEAEGWTYTQNLAFGSYQVTQFPGSSSNPHFDLYQVVSDMPAGTYKLQAYGFYRPDAPGDIPSEKSTSAAKEVPAYLYLNSTQQRLLNLYADYSTTALSEGITQYLNGETIYVPNSRGHVKAFFDAGHYCNTVDALVAEDGNLTVGMKYDEWISGSWGVISDFHLYYYGPVTVDENKEWDASIAGTYNIALTRNISDKYINTLVLPFSMTAEEVNTYFGDGETAPVVYVVGSYANDNISLAKKTDGIEANKPVLLKATKAGTYYKLPNRTLEATSDPSTTTSGVQFTGVYTFTEGKERFEVPANSYIVSSNNFIKVSTTGDAVLKSTRAYFTLPAGSDVKALTFSFDGGETTGIATVEDGQLNILTGKVYDLSGREVKNPSKGLYIIDGRKVMIK